MLNPATLTEGEKVLVVDDDIRLCRLLERFPDERGHRVHAVESTEQMDRLLSRELFRPVAPDLMPPDEDDLITRRRLRGQSNQVLTIMFVIKGDEGSCTQGLKLGVDDYLAKPFNPRKLLAWVKIVLRRQAPLMPGAPAGTDEVVALDSYQLLLAARELRKGDKIHMLTTGEFAVLKVLVQHARESLTQDKLMNLTRGREQDALERSIDVQISRLRRLIEPSSSKPRHIRTVWGVDYIFIPGGNAHKT